MSGMKSKAIAAKLPANVRPMFADIRYCKQKLSQKEELLFSVPRNAFIAEAQGTRTQCKCSTASQ